MGERSRRPFGRGTHGSDSPRNAVPIYALLFPDASPAEDARHRLLGSLLSIPAGRQRVGRPN